MTKEVLHFFGAADHQWEQMEEGIDRAIYTADRMQVVVYRFAPGKTFPEHLHEENEQLGYLVSGQMGLRIGNEERTLTPGDFFRAPAGVVHSAWTMDEESILIDIFSPPRTNLL